MAEELRPTDNQLKETSPVAFRDPFGDDPESIPDPMPSDLQVDTTAEEAADEFDGMEGDAPSG